MSFVPDEEYVFIGKQTDFYPVNSTVEKNNFRHFKLGKFLHLFSFKTPTEWAELSEQKCTGCAFSMRNGVNYTDFSLNGDIIPNAKARFEFGMVDLSQYGNVIDVGLEQKKYT